MILLRPEWLWLVLIWLPLLLLMHQKQQLGAWQKVIDANLLKALKGSHQTQVRRFPWLLFGILLLINIALSGPALNNGTQQTASQGNLIVILDNSLSMAATDLTPDRLTRAKRMIFDWSSSGLFDKTTVITYSGSAHTVTPLTSDTDTLEVQLQPLKPFIMPQFGSRPDLAFAHAKEVISQNELQTPHLLWLTDDLQPSQINKIEQSLPKTASATIVTVGTQAGSPIPLGESRGNLTQNGSVVMVQTDHQKIADLAQPLGFNYQPLGALPQADFFAALTENTQQRLGIKDIGFYLLIPICLLWLWFNKRYALSLLVVVFISYAPNNGFAAGLFENKDQQAYRLLDSDPEKARTLSKDPAIQAEAYFRSGEFSAAANTLKDSKNLDDMYNRANALAHSGKLEEALALYDDILQQGSHPAAEKNRELIKQYLQNQPSENGEQQGDSDQQQENSENSAQNQQNSNESTEQNEQASAQQQDQEQTQNNEEEQSEAEQETTLGEEPDEAKNAEEMRAEQQTESILNQLQTPTNSVLQNKFQQQYLKDPTEAEGSLW